MIYKNLKSVRQEKKLTQNEVADYLKIARTQYHLYESGKREIPLHLVKELALFYNLPLSYLIDVNYENDNFDFDTKLSELHDDYKYLNSLLDKSEYKDNEDIIRAISRIRNTIYAAEIEAGYICSKCK